MKMLVSHIARRGAFVAAVVLAGAVMAAPLHAQATPADSAAHLAPMVVTAAPGLSDSMRVMLAGHIADSATLARMSRHDRVVRLMDDNRYLASVTRDQDKRIDALEKRIKTLAAQRQQLRAQDQPPVETRDSVVKRIEIMQQRLDSLERVKAGQPRQGRSAR